MRKRENKDGKRWYTKKREKKILVKIR
jgi:hypothetical protein